MPCPATCSSVCRSMRRQATRAGARCRRCAFSPLPRHSRCVMLTLSSRRTPRRCLLNVCSVAHVSAMPAPPMPPPRCCRCRAMPDARSAAELPRVPFLLFFAIYAVQALFAIAGARALLLQIYAPCHDDFLIRADRRATCSAGTQKRRGMLQTAAAPPASHTRRQRVLRMRPRRRSRQLQPMLRCTNAERCRSPTRYSACRPAWRDLRVRSARRRSAKRVAAHAVAQRMMPCCCACLIAASLLRRHDARQPIPARALLI